MPDVNDAFRVNLIGIGYEFVFEKLKELANRKRRQTLMGIDLELIDAFRQERVTAGIAPKTVYSETVIIRQLVNFALIRKMISADPLVGLKIKEPKPNPQPCWTPPEVACILDASQEPQRWAFEVLAETGMRIGELRWLTWADVDFERNVLHIRAKAGWKPKSGDRRAIPISENLRRVLGKLPRNESWVLRAPPSIKYPRGDHQISERRLLVCLKRVLKTLGLVGHLHTFRHAFISRAVMAGTPEAVVRDWVGHVDRDIMKLYTHIADSASQAAMRKLSETHSQSAPSMDAKE